MSARLSGLDYLFKLLVRFQGSFYIINAFLYELERKQKYYIIQIEQFYDLMDFLAHE